MRHATASGRRYARALLDLAIEGGRGVTVARDLASAAGILATHQVLAEVLSHPTVAVDRKKKIIASVWEKGTDPLIRRLLDLLVDRGRVSVLPAVAAAFTDLWNAHRGVVPAEVVSAAALEPAQARNLSGAIGAVTGRTVDLKLSVDPSLIGGLRLRMEGRIYDGSARTRIEALRTRLAQARA